MRLPVSRPGPPPFWAQPELRPADTRVHRPEASLAVERVRRRDTARSRLFTVGVALLPVVYVLTVYLDQGVWLFVATRSVIAAAVISGGLVGLASLLLRDRLHGAFVALCIVLMLFAAEYPGVLVLLVVVAALIAADALVARRRRTVAARVLRPLHDALGVFGLLLLVVTLSQFGLRGQVTAFAAANPTASVDASAPDIWLVLLDGHPREDMLEREWGIEDPAFLDGLEDLGFDVADRARSNYNITGLTLPAMLDMALLQDLDPWSDYDKPADAPASARNRALQHNRAFDTLREHGYHLTSISAGYTQVDIRAVDEFIDAGTADVVELHLLGLTALGRFLQSVDPDFGESQVGHRVDANLESLRQLAQKPSDQPRFVFAHIPAPHPPLAFATIERPIVPLLEVFDYPVETFGQDLLNEAYGQHIAEADDRVLHALRTIVGAVGDDAVIIVMSDHGSRTHGHEHALSPAEVDTQFATLFAARTPDGEELFGDDVMTTNVLSTVFNRYLGSDIPPVARVFESLDGTRYEE